MTPGEGEVQLSAQRLQELMLWHGKDEGNLPPAATLVNLSRDTIAALGQLQRWRAEAFALRATLAHIFWSSDSSTIRRTVLDALGAPPEAEATVPPAAAVSWAPSPNGLPRPIAEQHAPAQQATG
jgi:hypothetical protein